MFGMTWMIYGISYSLIQFFYVRMQIKFGAFGTGAIGACIKTMGCASIPLLTRMCNQELCLDPNCASTEWIELAIHFPASVLNGVGYGLSHTATSTIISDYGKRYNIQTVGHWLGAWMACIALGAAGVMVLGNISHNIGALNTFYVCAAFSLLSMFIYLALSFVARDIKIKVDAKKAIDENQKSSEESLNLGFDSLDDQVEASVSGLSPFRSFSQINQKLSSIALSSPHLPLPLTPTAHSLQSVSSLRMPNMTLADDESVENEDKK